MKCRPQPIAALVVLGVLATTPARLAAQEPAPADHSAHQTAAGDHSRHEDTAARRDDLLKKVQASQGEAKMAAMTELLAILVAEKKSCDEMMVKKHAGDAAHAAHGATSK